MVFIITCLLNDSPLSLTSTSTSRISNPFSKPSSRRTSTRILLHLTANSIFFFSTRFPAAHDAKPVPLRYKQQWISVLKLASKWRFNDLRKAAIHELHEYRDLTTIERTLLAREYDIPAWLIQGYSALVIELHSLDSAAESDVAYWTPQEFTRSFGCEVVLELYIIALSRCRAMLCDLPLKEIQDDIFASLFLKKEYEAMKKRSQVYCTREEIREMEKTREPCKETRKKEAKALKRALLIRIQKEGLGSSQASEIKDGRAAGGSPHFSAGHESASSRGII
jgi:hypothetical protein